MYYCCHTKKAEQNGTEKGKRESKKYRQKKRKRNGVRKAEAVKKTWEDRGSRTDCGQ